MDPLSGSTREPWLETLAEDVARLRARRQDLTLVSSGAVAIGRHALTLHQTTLPRTDRQAAAALGQMHLAAMYRKAFARHRLKTAQLLLGLDDTTERRRLLSVRASMLRLLSLQTIPVVNENDAVARSAASFGDNDRLAARVARIIGGDTLVLLSDVDGLYSADPKLSSSSILIREVHDITPEIERMAGGRSSSYSSGGMITKLMAARMALATGCAVIIADGRDAHPLSAIDAGRACTWFHPSAAARSARKAWIAGTLRPAGVVGIDDSTAMQLRLGESLYLAGVRSFDGQFARGDAVIVRDNSGSEIARGLTIYSSNELRGISARSGLEDGIPVACSNIDQLVHSDDLALTA
ncbi:glutamate 5-kinase [Bradyrhizobium arachidis]|nr:glutamate 5-kinase [Bradyrhizobium arachidis]